MVKSVSPMATASFTAAMLPNTSPATLIKELEQKKLEAENSEIVDIVRGMSISLTELPLLFEKLKDGGTLGQSVPKSEEKKKEEN